MRVEVATERHRDAVAEHQVLLHPLPAQIEIAIAQARVLGDEALVGDPERRPARVAEATQFADPHFDLAGLELVVDRVGGARRHLAEDGHHHLGLELLGLAEQRLGLGDHLGHAVPVADVEEDHRAHVAHAVHPAEEDHLLADVLGTEFTAGVSSVQIAEKVHRQGRREKGEVKRKSKGKRSEGTRDRAREKAKGPRATRVSADGRRPWRAGCVAVLPSAGP